MGHYTLKTTANGALVMHNEQGNEVCLMQLLTDFPQGRVYAFYGEMGAGKTTFIKGLCQEMGIRDEVNSPTFAIVNVYDIPQNDTPIESESGATPGRVYHFDCYRLKSASEAMDIGTDEYLYSGQYCFIEWPENIETILPEDTVVIHIKPISDNEREINVTYPV